jgi:hypothetical protein
MMEEDNDAKLSARTRVGIEVTYWIATHEVLPIAPDDECNDEQGQQGTTKSLSKHYFDATNASEVRVGLPIGAEPVKVRTCC